MSSMSTPSKIPSDEVVKPSSNFKQRADEAIADMIQQLKQLEGSSSASPSADVDPLLSAGIENLSASEIFELSERLYAANMSKQEEVFDRVLKSMESLPGRDQLETSATLSDIRKDPNYLLVQSIYNENKRAREQRELERQARKLELAEQRELSLQREQLRQRFDNPDDVDTDAVGVPEKVDINAFFAAKQAMRDDIDDIDLGPLANFNIVDILSSGPFTDILSQVERDLEDTPYEESEELSELFAMLDAAKEASKSTESKSAKKHDKFTSLVSTITAGSNPTIALSVVSTVTPERASAETKASSPIVQLSEIAVTLFEDSAEQDSYNDNNNVKSSSVVSEAVCGEVRQTIESTAVAEEKEEVVVVDADKEIAAVVVVEEEEEEEVLVTVVVAPDPVGGLSASGSLLQSGRSRSSNSSSGGRGLMSNSRSKK